MSEEHSLDVTGLGKALANIPDDAKRRPVYMICDVLEKVLRPATATTDGIGRWIEAKFDSLIEPQQNVAESLMMTVAQKVSNSHCSGSSSPKPRVFTEGLERASLEESTIAHELWTNLLAHELLGNDVHPEIVKILGSLAPADARTLIELSTDTKMTLGTALVTALCRSLPGAPSPPWSFSHQHLKELGLTWEDREMGHWVLTNKGRALLESVSDPRSEWYTV